MENLIKIKSVIEALLIVSETGLTREEMRKAIGRVELQTVETAVNSLKEDYSKEERAFNIAEIAGRCRIVTKPEYMPWISNLYEVEPDRLTGPSLETLAIIAYKQPVTRAEIEAIRGVNVGGVLKTLLEKDLLEIKGRKDVPGKPLMYGTTSRFLELFGINSLSDLPALREFTEEDLDFGKEDRSQVIETESGEGIDPGEKSGSEESGTISGVGDEMPLGEEDTAERAS
jgi:segregation and condensation protein B